MTETLLPPLTGSPVAVLASVTDVVADLQGTLWAARTPQELLGTVTAVERLRSVLDAVELGVVAEVDATSAAATQGWASTKDWLGAATGGRHGAGRRLLALARAVEGDRAATGAALAAGRISLAQAEAVIATLHRLPADTGLRDAAETLLLGEARTRNAGELAGLRDHVLERLDPDGTARLDERAAEREERSAHANRSLSITDDGLGGVRVRGCGTVEDAAHLKAALFPLAAPEPTGRPGDCGGQTGRDPAPGAGRGRGRSCGVTDCAHDGRDPRGHGTRLWDALVEAARRLSGTDLLPTSHGNRPRIAVTIDLDTLRARFPDSRSEKPTDRASAGLGTGLLETGGTLSASAVRRLACDAEILPLVLGSRSQILDVGRTSRLTTLGLWLALLVRDQHCAFPGCTRPPIACDAHHIVHWADGGPTTLDNLVMLCRTHHTVLHTTPLGRPTRPRRPRPRVHPATHPRPTPHTSPAKTLADLRSLGVAELVDELVDEGSERFDPDLPGTDRASAPRPSAAGPRSSGSTGGDRLIWRHT